ncbi:MAG: glycogen phosphorylase [Actinomycetota bacterium]|nr:glycogen phosphorylase [Actinomycetota bacterium]
MKALRSFAVRAALPEPLQVLETLALNLRWSWDTRTIDLFRWVDGEAWEQAGHDPMRMLGLVSKERYEELLEDGPFMSFLASVAEDLDRYLEEPRWYQARESNGSITAIAYFSPEFGVSEAIPIYSGGLGVLAGDHLKAASDLGVPLVAVGLLYREGYFRQHLNADGWQQERYPALDPHAMPLTLLRDPNGEPLQIDVDLGINCAAQIWLAQVGRVPLLLLDCDVEANAPEERAVTNRLYGGGSEHRLRQEIVLGIGGVRALDAAGYTADVFHSNEGHAGFMGLERIRRLMAQDGLSFPEAVEAVRAGTVFTTHTPVPAGIDVYEPELMERYFKNFAAECGLTFEELVAVGQAEEDPEAGFNMAVMGFRLASRSNGVSKLHGHVSRAIFAPLWAAVPQDEVPIGSITNGVHLPTWLGTEMAEVLDRRFPPEWAESGSGRWDRVQQIPDAELWRARERARERLVYFVRARMREQLLAHGVSESEASWADDVFDPGLLTIGFARRFAPYKRGTLLLTDIERLKRLLLSGDRPIQVVLAGKAHPLDDPGKELIRQLVHFAADPEVRGRFAFIEDYDIEVARVLTAGADVWLNTPRRPMEASGTSGMKAALNGVINVSILDGWWDESYDGQNGWTIGTVDTFTDFAHQDQVEASALYDLLERDVVPRFYDRPEGPVPRRWIERMKSSIETLGPFVTADRMVRDYVTELYEPAAAQGRSLAANGFKPTRELAAWKERVRSAWSEVKVLGVEGAIAPAEMGESRTVSATIRTGELSPEDILVQLAHGAVGANGELTNPSLGEMKVGHCADGTCTYEGTFDATKPGLYGFAVRVLPAHSALENAMALGLVAWA